MRQVSAVEGMWGASPSPRQPVRGRQVYAIRLLDALHGRPVQVSTSWEPYELTADTLVVLPEGGRMLERAS